MTEPDDALLLGQPRLADGRPNDGVAWLALMHSGREAAKAAAGDAGGDFAVALRDQQGRAFLAVDRFAARTLCYRVTGGTLQFAERADALAAADAALDPQSLFDYLYFHVVPSPRTVFAGVKRLPPGHALWFEDGQATVAPYWAPRFEEAPAPSFEALRDEFRSLLRESVARALDGGKPACFLSGGTDSSTVAGMIGEVTGRAAATYSIGFEAEGYDEMAFARIAAQRFGTEHHEYYVTPDDLVRSIPAMAAHFDQPFGNSSALPAYYCALKAREDGVTRLLAGDGGDELFGGNSRYAKQRVFGVYDRLPGVLRHALLEPLFGLPGISRVPGLKKGASYIEQARVPLPDRLQMYNLMLRLGAADVLTPQALAAMDQQGPLKQQREVWASVGNASDVNKMLAFDWRYTLAESDLPKVRAATSLAGVEVAYPMLDRALLDFSLRLPTDYKLRGLKLRWFFKEALRDFLPDEIITKKKQGFGLPFGVWANRHEPLKRLAVDSLRSLSTRGLVRPEFIDTLVTTHLPAHPGYYGEMVWILMMLEQWLRAHAPGWRLPA
jgi:asparagine synthase (glutamine-hydrolysing)